MSGICAHTCISLSSGLSQIAPCSKLEIEERRTCKESGINRRSAQWHADFKCAVVEFKHNTSYIKMCGLALYCLQ